MPLTQALAAKVAAASKKTASSAPVKPKAPEKSKAPAKPKAPAKAKALAKPKAPEKPKNHGGFTHEELEEFQQNLLEMRKQLLNQVSELRQQSLLRHDEVNQDEDGTDAFERVTSLDRANVEHAEVVQINNALMAIQEGTYGLCENCHGKIEKTRLKALPFAKTCIQCQSAMEDPRTQHRSAIDLWD